MAKEIKTLDIDNESEDTVISLMQQFGWELKSSQRVYNQSSRPIAAFTYDGATYIHNETNTVDFTKLVFERDKKMPFYAEIVARENEFFELMANMPDQRPQLAPRPTMEEWARKEHPWIMPIPDLCGIMVGCLALFIAIITPFAVSAEEVLFTLFVGAPLYIAPALIVAYIVNRIKIKTAPSHPRSRYLLKMMQKYGKHIDYYKSLEEAVEAYDHATVRMPQILEEVSELVSD